MEPKEILKSHFAETIILSDDEFNYFYSHLKPYSLKKGQSLIKAGAKVDAEYFVAKGCLKTFYLNDNQKMFILQFAMPGWWASDYGALYSGSDATVNLDCVTDAEVLSLSSEDREKLCREMYQFEYFFRWRSNIGLVAAQERLLSCMNNNVKQRYEELLSMYPLLYNIVTKKLIAAYLGVSRETLSRLN